MEKTLKLFLEKFAYNCILVCVVVNGPFRFVNLINLHAILERIDEN